MADIEHPERTPTPFDEARDAIMQGAVRLYQGVNAAEGEVESLRQQLERAVDDPRLIETLARVIENRHGTLHGIGSTLREALTEYKRGR